MISISPQTASLDTSTNQLSTQQFTATVSNASNTTVVWQVNGVQGGNSSYGTISDTGLYTAPLLVPAEPVKVTAIAQADTSRKADAPVTLAWAVTVNISPVNLGPATVRANESYGVFANVDTYSNEKGVTWTINGNPQGSTSLGIISAMQSTSEGLNYIAPVNVSTDFTVNLKATSKANPAKSKTYALTVTPNDPADPILTISPTAGSMPVATQQQFTAYVDGQPIGYATWMVNGATTPPLTEGRMKNGLYTSPFEVPAEQVVVTVTYSSTHVKTASAVVSITPPAVDPNSKVSGDYAFLFTDQQHTSNVLGKITADGAGKLTGVVDINSTQGQALNYALSGTYKIGLDGRGTALVKLPTNGGGTIDATFHLMLVSNTRAFLWEADMAGTGTGFIEKQDASALANSAISGPFAFLLNGTGYEAAQPAGKNALATAIVGTMNPNGLGGIDGGQCDVSASGQATNRMILQGASSYNIGADGRGTATLSFDGTDSHFSVVVVSAHKVLLSTSDPVTNTSLLPLLIGTAEKSDPVIDVTALAGPHVYFARGSMYVQMGRFVGDTSTDPPQITGVFDERGQLSSTSLMNVKEALPLTGTYQVSQGTRVAAPLWRNENGVYTQQMMFAYPTSPEKFFFIETGLASSAEAVSGEGYAQHGTSFDETTLQGRYALASEIDQSSGWLDRDADGTIYSMMDSQGYTGMQTVFYVDPPNTVGIGRMNGSTMYDAFNSGMFKYYIVNPARILLMGMGPDSSYVPNDFGWMELIQ